MKRRRREKEDYYGDFHLTTEHLSAPLDATWSEWLEIPVHLHANTAVVVAVVNVYYTMAWGFSDDDDDDDDDNLSRKPVSNKMTL
ncbi:hypothetical protein AND_003599 [Anopheles darlingi]|uniref:Uncharacterized protein n=1 Tax=Anopheles darlingi TaxID=43151 RepID=W5JKI7_ANODA|nr:hypothetical protein AND_003599 [Anopheles darlingi]